MPQHNRTARIQRKQESALTAQVKKAPNYGLFGWLVLGNVKFFVFLCIGNVKLDVFLGLGNVKKLLKTDARNMLYSKRREGLRRMEKPKIEFKRKAYQKMLAWKKELTPNYALFLKGARRVGKSTLANKLGREEYKSYIEISFDKAPEQIKDLFVNSLEDLDLFFSKLQLFYRTKLYPRESLIILDEIQLFPAARQALKTLLEDKRYDYLETGSLASISKKSKKILIPSEEYSVPIYPMDFEEFLLAKQDDMTMGIIREHFESLKPFSSLRRDIMLAYREYMLVGGMPQAVDAYLATKDFGKADFVKQNILNLYESDIEDQGEENPEYVKNILLHIPSELSKHDKRYQISHLGLNARLRDYKGPFGWLDDAMIVNIAENVSDPSAAFNLSTIDPRFKCYMMDTGLLVSLAYKNREYLENELYKAILFDKLHVNEGMIVENVTAQILKSRGDSIYYYRHADERSKATDMEIDFLIRRHSKVVPIEVKSSSADSTASLMKFKKAFSNRIGPQYVLYDGDIKRDGEIIYLPYFMATVI